MSDRSARLGAAGRAAAGLAAVLALCAFGAASCAKGVDLTIAAGGSSGSYYPLAESLAAAWRDDIPGLGAKALVTTGSAANARLLSEGKANVALVQNDIAYYAAEGLEMFKGKPMRGLKGLATLFPEACHILVRADSGITGVSGLKGRRVATGPEGTAAEASARQILEAAGMGYGDMTVSHKPWSEAASGLKGGTIDAVFLTAGWPAEPVRLLGAAMPLALVPLDNAIIERLTAAYPFYSGVTIPSGTYRGMESTTATVAVKAMLAVSGSVSVELAEKLLKALYADKERLGEAGALVESGAALDGMSLPLHPGAEKYFGKPAE